MQKSNLRIITGLFKGKRLFVPKKGTRPMTDLAKSALFSMISFKIPNAKVLDLYAGTGALSIESMSRGAKSAVLIEKSKEAIKCIRENLKGTGIENKISVFNVSVKRFLESFEEFSIKKNQFDIIFFTPPHLDFKEKILCKTSALLRKRGLIVVEHSKKRKIKFEKVNLNFIEERTFAGSTLSFFTKKI